MITNGASAKQAIDIIRLVPDGKKVTQVSGDGRFGFVGTGWLSNDTGLAPGSAMTLSVRADGLQPARIEMTFMNALLDVEMPDNVPYGLLVLMRNHIKTHDRVGVGVIGPQ